MPKKIQLRRVSIHLDSRDPFAAAVCVGRPFHSEPLPCSLNRADWTAWRNRNRIREIGRRVWALRYAARRAHEQLAQEIAA